jgi:hypothetical protein
MTTGTLEALSVLHDHTLDDDVLHKMVHDVIMNVTGDYTIEEHHATMARWRPGWGSREETP